MAFWLPIGHVENLEIITPIVTRRRRKMMMKRTRRKKKRKNKQAMKGCQNFSLGELRS